MKIQARLVVSIVASVLVSSVIACIAFSILWSMKIELERSRVYDEVITKTNALNLLLATLKENSNPSDLPQILNVHASLADLLNRMSSADAPEESLIRQIQRDNEELGVLLKQVPAWSKVVRPDMEIERRDILESQVWMKVRYISDETCRLREMSRSRIVSAQANAGITVFSLLVILIFSNTLISILSGRKIVRSEETLRESEERYRSLVETSSDWVWEVDDQGRYTHASPKVRQILGYSPEEIIGRTPFDFMPEQEARRVETILSEFAYERRAFSLLENLNLHRDGRQVMLETSGVPIVAADGKFRGYRGMARDITERRRSEEEIRELSQRLTYHVENSPLAVIEWGADMRLIRWSVEAERLFGWKADEVIGKRMEDFRWIYNEDENQVADVSLELSSGTNQNRFSSNRNYRKDGSVVQCEWYNSSLLDNSGKLRSILSLVLDVTERTHAENALRQSEARYRMLHESLRDAFVQVSMDGKVLELNDHFCRMLGYSPEEVRALAYPELTPERWHAFEEKIVREQIIPRGYSDVYEKEYRRKDGTIIPVELRAVLSHDASGLSNSMWAIVRDTTERKRMEETLRTTVQRFNNILSNISSGILVLSEDGRVEFANQTFCAQFNISENPSDLVGFTAEEIAPRVAPAYADPAWNMARIRQILSLGRRTEDEEIPMRNGRVLLRDYLPILVDGKQLGRMWQHRDITERKQMEEELRKSRDELEQRVQDRTKELKAYMARLEESNQALQDFASIAAHDLQEPLRKVRTFGGMLKQKWGDSLGDQGNGYLERVLNANQRMESLLAALLEYSRLTTRADPFVEVPLTKLIHEVLSDLEVRIQGTGGEVQIGDLPAIQADPTQMRQLFQNLIGNALKFHKESEKPRVRVYCDSFENNFCRIIVEDNGIGFEEEYAGRIFAPFQRLHGRNSQYKGTGMGLAICKKIVERHGGSITARSVPGKGSAFIFTLPLEHPTALKG